MRCWSPAKSATLPDCAPRLAAHIRVGALRRLAEQQGGFATILAKGDTDSGDILLVHIDSRTSSANPRLFQQMTSLDGGRVWTRIGQDLDSEDKISEFLARKRAIDRDLWLVELDIADWQRFADALGELV